MTKPTQSVRVSPFLLEGGFTHTRNAHVKPIKQPAWFVKGIGSLKLSYFGYPKMLMSCVESLIRSMASLSAIAGSVSS